MTSPTLKHRGNRDGEARAKARAEAERADYEAKVAARETRTGRAKGKHPKPPDETPRADEQSNLSDPDSWLMRKSKQHGYRQAYNAQAVVDAGGSQLIVGARVTNCASDRNELVADIAALAESGIEALVYARLSAVATASRLPTANRGSNNSYTTSWDTTPARPWTPHQTALARCRASPPAWRCRSSMLGASGKVR